MGARVLLVAPLAAMLTGCAALSGAVSKAAPATSRTVIAWTDAKPSGLHQGLATPVAGSLPRPCQRKDLQAIYGGATGPVNGTMTGLIDLINIGQAHSDCLIQGTPTVKLFARQGEIALAQRSIADSASSPVILNPAIAPPPPLTGKAGGAWLEVQWRVSDSGISKCSPGLQPATVMQLWLANFAEAIPVDYFADKGDRAVIFCPPDMGVGAFQPVVESAVPQSVTPQFWKATLEVPPTAAAGTALNYRVTLQNVYYRALEFRDGCPEYIEVLGGPDNWTTGKEFFLLNCDGMGVIAPGASVTFAMVIQIPPSAAAGKYFVGWELDTGEASYGGTDAPFTVTAH